MTTLSSMNKVWRKAPFTIGAVIVLVVIAANVLFSWVILKKQGLEIAQLEESVRALSKGKGAKSGVNLAQLMEDVERFKKRLPQEKKLTRILGGIFSVAKKNGLVVPTGEYEALTSKETDISRYTITIPVEGRYSQIKKFIYDVETLRYPLAIEDVTLTSSRALDGNIGLKVRVSVYFL